MKVKIASLIISLLYIPLWAYFTYRLLLHINAPEVLWFMFWLMIPFNVIIGILSKLAEWEED